MTFEKVKAALHMSVLLQARHDPCPLALEHGDDDAPAQNAVQVPRTVPFSSNGTIATSVSVRNDANATTEGLPSFALATGISFMLPASIIAKVNPSLEHLHSQQVHFRRSDDSDWQSACPTTWLMFNDKSLKAHAQNVADWESDDHTQSAGC